MQVPTQGGTLLGIQILADGTARQALIQGVQAAVGEFLIKPNSGLCVEAKNGACPGGTLAYQRRGRIQRRQ
ncbi:hypothetical protein D3C76_1543660 [compost metagenome]